MPARDRTGGLTSAQLAFVNRYAARTGLDPNVVAAQVYNEENGAAAQSYEQRGFYDFLNIGITDSGPRGAGYAAWRDPIKAADASAAWMQGKLSIPGFGYASPGIRRIAGAAGQPPAAQIRAIQSSGWASSGYPNLAAIYGSMTGAFGSRGPRPSGGGGIGGFLGGVAHAVASPFEQGWSALSGGIGDVVGFLKAAAWLVDPRNWLRALETGTGFSLILLGLYFLATAAEGSRGGPASTPLGKIPGLPGAAGAVLKTVKRTQARQRADNGPVRYGPVGRARARRRIEQSKQRDKQARDQKFRREHPDYDKFPEGF